MALVLILLLIIASIAVFAALCYKDGLTAVSFENHLFKDIEIPSGSSTSKIASILKAEGLIKNELVFRMTVKKMDVGSKLKAGNYLLNTGMDVESIIHELTKGAKNRNVIRFTIPEGYELHQMAKKLSDEGLVDKEAFLKLTSNKKSFEERYPKLKELSDGQSLEGFLYPSTYEIYIGSTEEDIINKMLSQFMDVYENEVEPNIGELVFF